MLSQGWSTKPFLHKGTLKSLGGMRAPSQMGGARVKKTPKFDSLEMHSIHFSVTSKMC